MKNSLAHLLLNFILIAILTSSCTLYKHDRQFGGYLTDSQAREIVSNLEVNDRIVAKMKDGSKIRGKVFAVNDTSFVVRDDRIKSVVVVFTDSSDHMARSTSAGLKPNQQVVLKHRNGETTREKIIEMSNDELVISRYDNTTRDFINQRVYFSQLTELRFKKSIKYTIKFQDLTKLRYDVDVPLSIIANTVGIVGGLYLGLFILLDLTLPEDPL